MIHFAAQEPNLVRFLKVDSTERYTTFFGNYQHEKFMLYYQKRLHSDFDKLSQTKIRNPPQFAFEIIENLIQ